VSLPRLTSTVPLGRSGLHVSRIGLGTMTFGEQVGREDAHGILDHALERGVDFIDTAEMYAVPARAETCGATETIIGEWFASRPGVRQRVVLATKCAGPSRGMPWLHGGSVDLTPQQIVAACDGSLKRLQTDVIDLYQIHWPNRNAAIFGGIYLDPAKDRVSTTIQAQLEALAGLVRAGKVRAIGLSNESPWGLMEFLRIAEQHGLPRVASVQNPYALVNRAVDNGLDEALHHSGVSLLAYSPLGFGTLTGKYETATASTTSGPSLAGCRVLRACASSAGHAGTPWPPRASTTPWHANTASRQPAWRWPSATATGVWPAR
jgi:aryl-alcohol dehydrogenase-like predicted oxidoreductase